jgi:hypothetical protein
VKKLLLKKPDHSAKIHKTGGTNITNVICNKYKIKCLIDGGAFCSISGPKLLDQIYPSWQKHLLPIKPDNFYSCTEVS